MVHIGSSVILKKLGSVRIEVVKVSDIVIDVSETDYPIQLEFTNGQVLWFDLNWRSADCVYQLTVSEE